MSDAPEKIWAYEQSGSHVRLWRRNDDRKGSTEYTRSDVAQAMVAAAYLDAANLHQSLWRETSAYQTDQIIKRTPTDARASLDAMVAKAREDALRDAAGFVEEWVENAEGKMDSVNQQLLVSDILALIPTGEDTNHD